MAARVSFLARQHGFCSQLERLDGPRSVTCDIVLYDEDTDSPLRFPSCGDIIYLKPHRYGASAFHR
jgi:hypothetical protein